MDSDYEQELIVLNRQFGNPSSNAILLGAGALIALGIADGAFKHSLYAYSPLVFWIFDTTKFVFLPALLLWLLYRYFRIKPFEYGLAGVAEDQPWWEFIGLVVFLAFILYVVYQVAWNMFPKALWPLPAQHFYDSIMPQGNLHFPLALYYAVTAGVTEEIIFRGLPLLYLKEKCGKSFSRTGYVLVTSVLFAAAHWENGSHEVAATFIFGVIGALLYLQLHELWPLIGAHALVDLWAFA